MNTGRNGRLLETSLTMNRRIVEMQPNCSANTMTLVNGWHCVLLWRYAIGSSHGSKTPLPPDHGDTLISGLTLHARDISLWQHIRTQRLAEMTPVVLQPFASEDAKERS
jgi:hypothetical protein